MTAPTVPEVTVARDLAVTMADGTRLLADSWYPRERFTAVLGARPRARVLLEASTESEWVARYLESVGREVIVADPNYAPMDANRSRRTKTDQRNARTLGEGGETGAYRPRWLAGAGERECLGAHADRRPRSVAGADHGAGTALRGLRRAQRADRGSGSAPRDRRGR